MRNTYCFLIDNDEDDREIFALALQEAHPGMELQTAASGPEGLEQLSTAQQLPSLVFIDLNMPLMNGRQCLEAIRGLSKLDRVPVYLYSTAADPGTIATAKKGGATDFLIKPASFTALVDLLSGILQQQNQPVQ
jgi:CheY-like chemotaxis protein